MTCAIYCRLSKEDEHKAKDESESIQNQKALLLEYAMAQEWEVYDIYCDEDYSGADRNRPDFNRMLKDARERKFQTVLCKTQSRFTRDMELVEKYIHGLFPLWGIRFVAVVDHVDTEIRGNKKARQINGLVNEWYLEELSENVRAVFAQKRQAGQYIGSFAAYGYRKDPADRNHLVIDEEAAAIVREIFRLYQEGLGTQRIAAELNRRGIQNPTRYKQLHGLAYGNGSGDADGRWTHTGVGRILRNELYTGMMVQGMKRKASFKSEKLLDVPAEQWIRVPDTHDAIIDRETFQAVQKRLSSHTRLDGSGTVHPLAGKVRCLDCGGSMQRMTTSYKGVSRSYLICKSYANTRLAPACTKHTVRLERLVDLVEERVRAHTAEWYKCPDAARFRDQDETANRIAQYRRELRALDARVNKLAGVLKTLYLDKVDGVLSQEEFMEMNHSLTGERQELRARMEKLRQTLEELAETPRDDGALQSRVQELLRLDPVPRELLELLLDYVEVGERDPKTGTQKIHIHWKA